MALVLRDHPSERDREHWDALLQLARLDLPDLASMLRAITEIAARTLDVERVGVWTFLDDMAAIRNDDTFHRTPGAHESGTILRRRDYPSYFRALATERVMTAFDAQRDPRTCEFTAHYLVPLGIGAMLDVPVWRRGRMVGIVCHEHVGGPRRWTREDQDFAASVADVVARAFEAEERRQAEQARERLLAELEIRAAQWESVLTGIADGVWVIERGLRVVYVNPAAVHLLGPLEPGTPLEGTFTAWDDEGRPLPVEQWPSARALRGETVRGDRIRVRRPTGEERVLQVSASRVCGGDQVVVVAADVTERAEFERLADEFIGVAAHELKTPVTVVKTAAQAIARCEPEAAARLRTLLGSIERGANRIDRITQDLLQLSRLRLGALRVELRPLDLAAMVHVVCTEFAAVTKSHPIRVTAEPAWVEGDEDRLTQALVNLLTNAVKYSPAGRPIDIELRADEGFAHLSVRDQGIGIPPDRIGGLFQRFYRAHAGTEHDRGGLGVGLYLARQAVLAHGGDVTVRTAEGQGSTFTITLPRIAPSERA